MLARAIAGELEQEVRLLSPSDLRGAYLGWGQILIREQFDLRPAAILRDLQLMRPIYAKTAAYGHFGRDDHDFTWERTDKADALRDAAGLSAEAVGAS